MLTRSTSEETSSRRWIRAENSSLGFKKLGRRPCHPLSLLPVYEKSAEVGGKQTSPGPSPASQSSPKGHTRHARSPLPLLKTSTTRLKFRDRSLPLSYASSSPTMSAYSQFTALFPESEAASASHRPVIEARNRTPSGG